MYDLIQKIFRRKLMEGRLATHSPSNIRGGNITVQTTPEVIEKVKNQIAQAMQLVHSNPNYGDLYTGDGVYQMDLYPNGFFKGKMTSLLDKREPGTYTDSGIGKKRSFYVKACTNIQHPDQPEKTCKPVGKSPMQDAHVKVLAYFGQDIIEFLTLNLDGEDAYTIDLKDKDVKQKDFLSAQKKERKDSELAKFADAKKNKLTLTPMEEKIALRNYAMKHNISALDIDATLRREILQQYQNSKSE